MNYKFVWFDKETEKAIRSWVREPPIKVGRGMFADISIDSGSISRRHCEFTINPSGALIVKDLGSKNGVVVDGRRVEEALVLPDTEVRIGLVTLKAEPTEEPVDSDSKQAADAQKFHGEETQPVKVFPPEDDVYDLG